MSDDVKSRSPIKFSCKQMLTDETVHDRAKIFNEQDVSIRFDQQTSGATQAHPGGKYPADQIMDMYKSD